MFRFGSLLGLIFSVSIAQAAEHTVHDHKHDHSQHNHPVGVMGNHIMEKDSWMFTYRYMSMQMDGNLNGTESVTNAQIFADGFMVAPVSMDMDMHMFGFMYGVSDKTTLMVMLPYIKNKMDLITMASMRFTTEAEGIGDVKLFSLVSLLNTPQRKLHLNLGISLPTGSIDERDDTPMMINAQLPYPMQLGSGTYDLIVGATYTGQTDSDLTWGLQGLATIRMGTNDNLYTLADKQEVSMWLAKPLFNSTNGSVRIKYQRWGNIDGADPALNPNMVPTANPDLRAGRRADLILGLQYGASDSDNLFSIELGLPVYQKLDGPQPETEQTLTLSWQYSF